MLKARLIAGIYVIQEHILKQISFLTLSAKQIGTTGISKVSRENTPAANKKINYFAAFVKTETIANTHDVLRRERFNNSVLDAQTSRSGLVK